MVYWRPDPVPKLPKNHVSLRRLVHSRDAESPSEDNSTYVAKVSCLAEIAATAVDWLWGNVIPVGKVTTLTGDPGAGKTFLALDISAEVTRGLGASGQCHDNEPGNVLLISGEADLADVAGPRLTKAGADLLRVHALRGVRRRNPKSNDVACWLFQLNDDLRLLELEIARQKNEKLPLRLIVIDPFPMELFAGPHGTKALIPTIKHLAEIAAWSQTAILLVATNTDDRQGAVSNNMRVLETLAPSAWTVVRDLDHPERRLLLPVKSNLVESPAGLSFRFQDNGLVWDADSAALTAEEYRAEIRERDKTPLYSLEQTEVARAVDWLEGFLGSNVIPLRTIKKEAVANDISNRTLHRAFRRLRGVTRRIDNSRSWEWRLPGPKAEATEQENSGTVEP